MSTQGMTRTDLARQCFKAIDHAKEHKITAYLTLFLTKRCDGKRTRFCPGVMAEVMEHRTLDGRPVTMVCLDPHEVLRAIDEGRL